MSISFPTTANRASSSSGNEADYKMSARLNPISRSQSASCSRLGNRVVVRPDPQDDTKKTIAMLITSAILRGPEAVEKLLVKVSNLGSGNNVLIRESCRQGWTRVVENLLERNDIDPTVGDQDYLEGLMPISSNAPLIAASLNGHTAIVKMLLQTKEVDPAAEDNKALVHASNGSIATLLLNHPKMVDPNLSRSHPALFMASYWGRKDVVEVLLKDQRVDPTVCQNAAIVFAVRRGWNDIVQHLLGDERVNPGKLGTYAEWHEAHKLKLYQIRLG